MAVNLTSAWCSGVSYNVPGYSWAVGDYVQYAQGACTGFTSDNGTWVTIPLWDFEQILADANAYNGGSTSGTSTASPYALSVDDGVTLGWLIVGVWAAAYVVVLIRRVLFSHEHSE